MRYQPYVPEAVVRVDALYSLHYFNFPPRLCLPRRIARLLGADLRGHRWCDDR